MATQDFDDIGDDLQPLSEGSLKKMQVETVVVGIKKDKGFQIVIFGKIFVLDLNQHLVESFFKLFGVFD